MNIGKPLAILLFPIGLIVILKATGLYSLNIQLDPALIGAIIMIVVQLLLLFMIKKVYEEKGISLANIISFIVFVGVAGYYIVSYFAGLAMWPPLLLILGVMMFLEGMYALH